MAVVLQAGKRLHACMRGLKHVDHNFLVFASFSFPFGALVANLLLDLQSKVANLLLLRRVWRFSHCTLAYLLELARYSRSKSELKFSGVLSHLLQEPGLLVTERGGF